MRLGCAELPYGSVEAPRAYSDHHDINRQEVMIYRD